MGVYYTGLASFHAVTSEPINNFSQKFHCQKKFKLQHKQTVFTNYTSYSAY